MEIKKISEFYKSEAPSFAAADNIRKIASYIDGLKLSARKLMYTLFEKYPKGLIKTAQFANFAAAFTNYNQGENNLGSVANTLAQSFCGANNYPLLYGKGNFGNRLDESCAATRYTFVSAGNFLNALFPEIDRKIAGNQIYEGEKIEPLFYMPVMSSLFINGSNGLSTGFRQVILPRKISDIVDYIKKRINGIVSPRMQLLPWFKNFKGSCRYVEDGHLEILGCIERDNMTTYRITELPIGTDYSKYCDFLDKLDDDGKIQSWNDKCDPKTNELLFEIRTTREFSRTHEDIEDLLKFFHLVKPFTEQYNCIDENNRVREFKSIQEILNAFIDIRLKAYQKRKDYMLESMKNSLIKLASKYYFVHGIVNGTIIVNKRKKDNIIAQLEKIEKIYKIDGSYEYLLSMPIHSLTQERLEELKKQIEDSKEEYKKTKETSIQDMWLADLRELQKCL